MRRKLLPKHLFLVPRTAIAVNKFCYVVKNAWPDIKEFIKAKDNYGQMRQDYPTFATSREAKKILSAATEVRIPRLSPPAENIAARDSPYPIKISKNSDFFIDYRRPVNYFFISAQQ